MQNPHLIKLKIILRAFVANKIFKILIILIIIFLEIWAFLSLILGTVFSTLVTGQTNCFSRGACNGNFSLDKNILDKAVLNDYHLQLNEKNNLVPDDKKSIYPKYKNITNTAVIYSKNNQALIVHYYIPTNDHLLSAYLWYSQYQQNSINHNQYMVLVHGASSDWTATFLLGQFYLKEGFNVVVYDHQGVQKNIQDSFGFEGSTGSYTTFGLKESDDLHNLITYLTHNNHSEFDLNTDKINVFGQSLGASTTMLYLDKYGNEDLTENNLNTATIDSAYANLQVEFQSLVNDLHLPWWLVAWTGALFIYLLAGYDLYLVNPIDNFNQVKVPCFFVQGTDDTYVSYQVNFWKIYHAYQNHHSNDYLLIENAKHCETAKNHEVFFKQWNLFFLPFKNSN